MPELHLAITPYDVEAVIAFALFALFARHQTKEARHGR
nr:MAG TPA: hypothetical protein [Caudoviricetes sp.]